ncbi:MAG: tRNA pseudouridine55 synthase [Frankiales bacterium]|jgi:tRNA pseudouridine55 synthase|nr:tRNA pseudouridine55 synthase [Frankiales bacterium]
MTTDGIVVIDKPAGWTSHDVVARVRRQLGVKKVGHAGTLDPMATGVLIVGVLRATRLLGFLAGTDKEYLATMRLGAATNTDDADGDVIAAADASGVTDDAVLAATRALTGDIMQVPSSVSAIKVDGVRAYKLARAGESPELPARPVRVAEFEVLARSGVDVDVRVVCSSGTYVRALARDVGATLGVGAHLTVLRRTRVGSFTLADAQVLDGPGDLLIIRLADAVAATFPRLDVDEDTARRIGQGQKVPLPGVLGPTGVFGPDGSVVALVEPRDDGTSRSLVGFVGASSSVAG